VPFLTFYTPTYKRPKRLARCLRSVAEQTLAAEIEHLVIPDHVGLGIGGAFQRVPLYRDAIHGDYVHLLCDDDWLADPFVVERVRDFSLAHDTPPVIQVQAHKGWALLPEHPGEEPKASQVDSACFVVRRDVWHTYCDRWGNRYEGDYDFARALWDAGYRWAFCEVLFARGDRLHGAPERL
jgi:glycosyltransferase involved in cell wall biosynthesis